MTKDDSAADRNADASATPDDASAHNKANHADLRVADDPRLVRSSPARRQAFVNFLTATKFKHNLSAQWIARGT